MIPPTDHTPALEVPRLDLNAIGTTAIASATRRLVAFAMAISEDEVAQAMARSTWKSVEGMISREFIGSYRRYYPKCGMALRDEAVIAEVFDSLAITFADPRRAVRCGAWTPPATRAGGRSDG